MVATIKVFRCRAVHKSNRATAFLVSLGDYSADSCPGQGPGLVVVKLGLERFQVCSLTDLSAHSDGQ